MVELITLDVVLPVNVPDIVVDDSGRLPIIGNGTPFNLTSILYELVLYVNELLDASRLLIEVVLAGPTPVAPIVYTVLPVVASYIVAPLENEPVSVLMIMELEPTVLDTTTPLALTGSNWNTTSPTLVAGAVVNWTVAYLAMLYVYVCSFAIKI